MFSIVHDSPQSVWSPLKDSETLYVGGIAGLDDSAPTEGLIMMPVAAGASNTTNKDIPFGVVIGTNNRKPLFNATGKTEYITDATPHDSVTEFVGHDGPWAKGGREAMVKVSLIDPTTILRGNIYNAAVGTAPSLLYDTKANAAGTSATTLTNDVAPVALWSTIYYRTGTNRGLYRPLTSTSQTAHTWDKPLYKDAVSGDTVITVNGLRSIGLSRMQLGATYVSYIECSAALTADYFLISVVRLDLTEQYKEYAEFRWDADNFCATRG